MTHVIVRTEGQMKRAMGESKAQYHVEDSLRDDLIFTILMERKNVKLSGAPGSKFDLVVVTVKDEGQRR
jgi:hypothetical protein